MRDTLGNRMKSYENVTRDYLTRRLPVIIRIDGKAFHTFTRGFQKPFDMILMEAMWETTKYLCKNIQGCKVAYTQSDEISLLITDYETIDTCSWFDSNILKMASVSASMATLAFNKAFQTIVYRTFGIYGNDAEDKSLEKFFKVYERKFMTALFDSRVFTIPKEEVCNYFIWRQQDATRNSIQMVGRANFTAKMLNHKSGNDIQDMLFMEKGINWSELPAYKKRGACIAKETYTLDNPQKTKRNRWSVDENTPIFTKDRDYIEKFL
jgi:Uncharacterized conserved protein